MYYLCRAIGSQGVKGPDWKFSLYPVYGVFFLNFKSGRLFSDRMRQIYLEMPFFTKDENECTTNFDRWLYVLKNMDKLVRMPFKAQKQLFEKLERMENDEALKIYRDCTNIVGFAEEKGVTKGYEKGLAEGKTKGKTEGLAEGEAKSQRLIATNFKKQGVSPDVIAQCTGLTTEEIESL